MSLWLKKRLGIWMGVSLLGGAVLWNGGRLRAQDYGGAPVVTREGTKMTRDEAAKEFGELLDYLSQRDLSQNAIYGLPASLSLKSKRELDYHANALMALLVKQWKQPDQIVKVQSEGNHTATVTLEQNTTPPIRPLVLVEES